MRLRCSKHILEVSLRQSCHSRRVTKSLTQCQKFSTSQRRRSNTEAKDIAVLGGGITGLTTALHLSKELPNAQITLYEKTDRLGGWLQSEVVDVDDGEVLFEHGPRTLRPAMPSGAATYELIQELGMEDQVLQTSKHSPAARNRYIYYPDHIVRLPSSLPGASTLMNISRNVVSVLTEPIFKGLPWAIFREPFQETRSPDLRDESVGDFISRRFNSTVANNLVSAIIHGIYAGNIYELSARTLFPLQWNLEVTSGSGSVLAALVQYAQAGITPTLREDLETVKSISSSDKQRERMQSFEKSMAEASVYTFKRGIGQLTEQLESTLKKAKNVKIFKNSRPTKMTQDAETHDIEITVSGNDTEVNRRKHDHIISTISSKNLSKLAGRNGPDAKDPFGPLRIPVLHEITSHAVTVMVVNLYYPNANVLPVRGFGYLIPRSIALDQNPERALGVIFGSDSSAGQDTAPGTKLTVMLGGHWWDGWNSADYPDSASAVEMAKAVLSRHLHIREVPLVTTARLQRDAIPQYRVGFEQSMRNLFHRCLLKEFGGRLRVAGSWSHGVGVNDCIKAGRQAAFSIIEGKRGLTGLERFLDRNRWVLVDQKGEVVANTLEGIPSKAPKEFKE